MGWMATIVETRTRDRERGATLPQIHVTSGAMYQNVPETPVSEIYHVVEFLLERTKTSLTYLLSKTIKMLF